MNFTSLPFFSEVVVDAVATMGSLSAGRNQYPVLNNFLRPPLYLGISFN